MDYEFASVGIGRMLIKKVLNSESVSKGGIVIPQSSGSETFNGTYGEVVKCSDIFVDHQGRTHITEPEITALKAAGFPYKLGTLVKIAFANPWGEADRYSVVKSEDVLLSYPPGKWPSNFNKEK